MESQALIYRTMASVLNMSVKSVGLMPYVELMGYYNLELKKKKELENQLKKKK